MVQEFINWLKNRIKSCQKIGISTGIKSHEHEKGDGMNDLEKSRVECLTAALDFEVLWAYYFQSSGKLFMVECRESAITLLASLEKLKKQDTEFEQKLFRGVSAKEHVEVVVEFLQEWAKSKDPFPYQDIVHNLFFTWNLLRVIKHQIAEDIGLSNLPHSRMSSDQIIYSIENAKWLGHLPLRLLQSDIGHLMSRASEKESVVMVGDIRKSQDLMTYSSPDKFADHMLNFITGTRALVDKYGGFFDKFTGDGFIVYFNPEICHVFDPDPIKCFLEFIKSERAFCLNLFDDWKKCVRKLPATEVGLAMGADFGSIQFRNLKSHLIAIGEPIVWANRMASVAKSDQVVVNNQLYYKMLGTVAMEAITGETKSGEKFLAYNLV